MHKIGDDTATANGAGEFDESIPTDLRAEFLNTVQRELLQILSDGGITPNKATDNQIMSALNALFLRKDITQTFAGTYLQLSHTQPTIMIYESDAAVDEKRTALVAINGEVSLRTYDDAWSTNNKIFYITRAGISVGKVTFPNTVSVGALQVGGISVIDSSRQYAVELIRAHSRTRIPAAGFDGTPAHVTQYDAAGTDVIQKILRNAANNYLFTNRGPISIEDSAATETFRVGQQGKMTAGIVPFARMQKTEASGSNAALINASSLVTAVTLSLGAVEVGDVIDITFDSVCTKDATAGFCYQNIEKDSGTAVIEFAHSLTAAANGGWAVATEIQRTHTRTRAVVTTAGTLTLRVQVSGGGTSNATYNAGTVQLQASVLQGS